MPRECNELRRHRPRALTPILTAAIMLSVSAATTTASEASPTPAPADITCAAIPRSWDDITSLLARSDLATPAATTDGTTLPDGTPADDEALAAMERTVREWLACQNAGQQLRAWSLFSNGYLHRLLSRQGGLSAEAFAGMATPVATEGGHGDSTTSQPRAWVIT